MTEKMVEMIVNGVVGLGILAMGAYAVWVISNMRRTDPLDSINNGPMWTYSVRDTDDDKKD